MAGSVEQWVSKLANSNRLSAVTEGANVRSFGHDGAGNITADNRAGTTYNYRYNKRGRLDQLSIGATVTADYLYDGLERMALRSTQNMTPAGTTHYVYDLAGRLIAEASDTGATLREYVWLDDLPLAVVADVDTASPNLYFVHADQLDRPVKMTDGSKAVVWDAVYRPFGEAHAITGSAANNLRFPGQYFLIEAGLHYNWHRHYDPTLGRYTQPDPLEFEAGPSLYAYARSAPAMYVDPDGRFVPIVLGITGAAIGFGIEAYANYLESSSCGCDPASGSAGGIPGLVDATAAGFVLGDNIALTAYSSRVLTATGGTSLTSSVMSQVLPYRMGFRVWSPTSGNFGAMTNVAGRAIGRWAPFASVALIGYDIGRIARCLAK
jgi:RHS repeat-associated protein